MSTDAPSTPSGAAAALARGQAALAAGRLAFARAEFLDAAAAAEREGRPDLRGEAAIGAGGLWLYELRIVDERAVFLALLRDALARLGDARPDLQRRIRIRLAAEAVYDGTGDVDDLRKVVDEARAAGGGRALAEGLSLLHHALLTPQYAHDRLPVADELITVASSIDDRTLRLMGMCWRTVDLFLLGHNQAERALAELRLRADQFDVLAVRYVVAAIDTMLSTRSGHLAEAEAMALAGHGLGLETGDADADAWYLAQIFAVRWMQGRAGEMLDVLEEIERSTVIVHSYAGYVWAITAALASEAHDHDRARAAVDRVFAAALDSLPESSAWLPALFCLAEAAQFLHDAAAASEIARALEPHASLPAMGSLAVVCFGSAARSLGLARRTGNDLEGAVAALESAVLQNRRIGHLPMLAITRADLAATLLERDRNGDRDRARDLLDAAIAAGASMEMDARVSRWRLDREAIGESSTGEASMRRRGAHWELRADHELAVVSHTVGVAYLATLLAHPHEDVRAAVLSGAVEDRNVQPVLDDRARNAYGQRVRELRREIDDADADADIERAATRKAELDLLLDELARVIRPGGRSRVFSGADERARTSVQKALRRRDRERRTRRASTR